MKFNSHQRLKNFDFFSRGTLKIITTADDWSSLELYGLKGSPVSYSIPCYYLSSSFWQKKKDMSLVLVVEIMKSRVFVSD